MVTVDYCGRTGNNLFQYSIARLIAEINNLQMGTEWCAPQFIEATEPKRGDVVSGDMITITDIGRLSAA
jgi:hypothetical protein